MVNANQDNPTKCEEPGCWHYKAQGFVYCVCCLHGKCYSIPKDKRTLAPVEEAL